MRPKLKTCKVCGWHGVINHHKPDLCARYLQIKNMYLAGKTSREIGQELGTSKALVLHALKAVRIKTRPRGGLNNPGGVNGRSRLTPLRRPQAQNS
ncbi:MAG: hypothetical protein ABSA59_22645 [Terriglobia bacterium]